MIRTYVDAGVLITAARGVAPIAIKALEVLDDSNRGFVFSVFLKLEVLPKALYYGNEAEAEFYKTFFDAVIHWTDTLDSIVQEGFKEACSAGLAAMDALHVASAVSLGADELVTTERAEKPIHRTALVRVVSITPSRV
ncbi:MAG TPA: nucleic acid-binding protein [Blastocatellia bacterium]|nr:nucleic acid-binding protein [Blastocatellia bacterium]